MPGTTIEDLKLTKVVDGDTVKVEIDGKEESLRLCCLDTEESWVGGSKPVTNAGKLASKWAKEYFGVNEEGFPTGNVTVTAIAKLDLKQNDQIIKHYEVRAVVKKTRTLYTAGALTELRRRGLIAARDGIEAQLLRDSAEIEALTRP